jgi:hypothetical protein
MARGMQFERLKIERDWHYVNHKRIDVLKGQIETKSEHGEITLNLSESEIKKIMAVVASSLVNAAEDAAKGLLESCLMLASIPPKELEAAP